MDRSVEPRLAQVFVPLLSVVDDSAARQSLRDLMRQYDRELVADRGMDMEAQVLQVIRDIQMLSEADLSIREITTRMIERHGEDLDRKITPHWVGYLVRKKLGLKTEQRHGGYMVASSEGAKLAQLYEKYGITSESVDSADSVDLEKASDTTPDTEIPLI